MSLDLADVVSILVLGVPADWVPVFSTGEPPEFAEVYKSASQAIAENPNNTQAYLQRGIVCQSKQWYPQALADFMEVVRRSPEHARAWLLISEVLAKLGQYDKAREVRQHALKLDPNLN